MTHTLVWAILTLGGYPYLGVGKSMFNRNPILVPVKQISLTTKSKFSTTSMVKRIGRGFMEGISFSSVRP